MADLEKLRKWQEERIARKLRGEYESAVLHLAEVVGDPVNLVRYYTDLDHLHRSMII